MEEVTPPSPPLALMKPLRLPLAVVALFALVAVAGACTIPVFRYALERWELTPYEVLVFHDAPLPAATEKYLTRLNQGEPAANVSVHLLEVGGNLSKAHRSLF